MVTNVYSDAGDRQESAERARREEIAAVVELANFCSELAWYYISVGKTGSAVIRELQRLTVMVIQ